MEETISRIDLAWLAGIYDGEGWFTLCECNVKKKKQNKTYKRVRCEIGLANTDFELLRKASEILYRLRLTFHYEMKKPANHFCIGIVVSGFRSCRKLIDRILPYIVAKRRQAMVMGEFVDYKISTYNTINDLVRNSKGQVQNNRNPALESQFLDRMKEAKQVIVDLQRLQRTASKPLALR